MNSHAIISFMVESSFQIKNFALKNRIVVPPFVRNLATDDGMATEKLLDSYRQSALSGASIVIVEATYVHELGRIFGFKQLGAISSLHLDSLRQVASSIKSFGIPAIIQLVHSGRMSLNPDCIAPSAIPFENGLTPREMTLDDISFVKECFVNSARMAIEAGFDGVEIHNAHGYLLSQFLSPSSNARNDAYGGSFENRSRLAKEIVSETRKIIGPEKILSVRLGACDMVKGGLNINDGVKAAKLFKEVGADLINVSVGVAPSKLGGSQTSRRLNFAPLARAIKNAGVCPVAIAGRITTKEDCEVVLEQGIADLVCVCRATLSDPLWTRKVLGEIEAPIIKCLGCKPKCSHFATGCPKKS